MAPSNNTKVVVLAHDLSFWTARARRAVAASLLSWQTSCLAASLTGRHREPAAVKHRAVAAARAGHVRV